MLPSVTKKEGEKQDFTLGSGTQDLKLEKNVLPGLIQRAYLHAFSTAFALGGGSAVTDGEKRIVKNFQVSSSEHGQLYYPTEVLAWYRFMTLLTGRAPAVTAVGASGFALALPIPLGFKGPLRDALKRENDLSLWCMKTKPVIEGIVDPITKLVTGGAPTGTMRVRPVFQVMPKPDPRTFKTPPAGADLVQAAANGGGDAPQWQVSVVSGKFASLTSTGPQEQLLPPTKGEIPLYIMVYERKISDDTEQSDVLNNRECKLSIMHGTDFVLNPVAVMDHDEENDNDLNVSQVAGYHFFNIIPKGKVLQSIVKDGFNEFKLVLSQAQKGTADDRELRFIMVSAAPLRSTPESQSQAQ